MKTFRTILATFGVTTLIYGIIALIAMRLNLSFTGRSIYQLFRETGFAALVIGIGCILSFVIMTIAIVSFRDDGARKKHDFFDEEDEDDFLEEETVPEERAAEADETWSPEIKRKQRRALFAADDADEEPEEPDEDPEEAAFARPEPLFADEEPEEEPEPEEPETPEPEEREESAPEPGMKRCIYCGGLIDDDSAFCIHCGKRV
ncbi:MAG: hypothetical protein IJJ86_00215 [Clostridia bacterium]|nr:hypothetical protein [Clostridia bacterium]